MFLENINSYETLFDKIKELKKALL